MSQSIWIELTVVAAPRSTYTHCAAGSVVSALDSQRVERAPSVSMDAVP